MKLRSILAGGLVTICLSCVAIWRLADHDLDHRESEGFDFIVSSQTRSGTLWLPDEAPHAAIVLVHGDGPQDRTSAGGYAPLVNTLLDHGIAVASWDKPGIGGSRDNWLHQSMADRTAETRAALKLLGERLDGIALGAVGFSQAGWVLPSLTLDDADFLVLIGAAVSWQDQGDYYTRTQLALDGMDAEAIERVITDQNLADERAYGENTQASDVPEGISRDRWQFIRVNRDEDAREALARLDLPVLAIWGVDDLNVDAQGDAAIYREVLAERNTQAQIIVWPEATHSLLKSPAYNWQLTEQWSWFAKLRFLLEGRHAFAPGALNVMTDWIIHQTQGGRDAK